MSDTGLEVGGNIFSTQTTANVVVIGHGVNTQGVMGAGFAKLISDKFPEVKSSYIAACRDGSLVAGGTQIVMSSNPSCAIANIASQQFPGADATVDRLRSGLELMFDQLRQNNSTTFDARLPLIGAGIGGIPPTVAADTIFDTVYRSCPENATVTLYLLPTDDHTPDVARRWESWQIPF